MTKTIKTQNTSDSPRGRKLEMKSGSLEEKLSWALNKPNATLKTNNKFEELNEISKFEWLEAPLSEREKLIAGALGYKGFEWPDWSRLLALTTQKPKLNIEVLKTIFNEAISSNNSDHLLYFGCIGPKTSQQIIAQMLFDKVEWSQIKKIIEALNIDKVDRTNQKKLQNSLGFLSCLVRDGDKTKLITSLVALAASLDENQFVLIAKPQKQQILKSSTEIFLHENYDKVFSIFLKSGSCGDDTIRKLVNNLTFYGIDDGLLSALIFKLGSAGRLGAVKQASVFKKFSLNLIASIAASKEILEFLLTEKDSYINQFRALLRQGGIGAVMQITDQNNNFDSIVQAEHDLLVDYITSKQPRSLVVIDFLVNEQVKIKERFNAKIIEEHNHETISQRDKALTDLEKSKKVVKELMAKVTSLDTQIRLGKKDQKLDHNKVIQQAQLQVLIEFAKYVEDLRVLLKGSFEDEVNLRSVHKNAEAKLRKLSVVIVGEIGTSPSDIQKYFKIDSVIGVDEKVVKSPAYIFRTDEQEVVLVWGELRDK